jgi:hypothetical protein
LSSPQRRFYFFCIPTGISATIPPSFCYTQVASHRLGIISLSFLRLITAMPSSSHKNANVKEGSYLDLIEGTLVYVCT